MQLAKSFDELQQRVAEIRALRRGFITNFFPDLTKHGLWIEKEDCFIERIGNSLFIIKKSPAFWNVFYCSTTIDDLEDELKPFLTLNPDATMMFDLLGREVQCHPLVEMFKKLGCTETTSLVRMTRMTGLMEYASDATVRYAINEDLPVISEQLHLYFDERTEQIPYNEELTDYANQKRVLVCEKDGVIAGFLIFELNATTLYLRYWFTHPDFRDEKVGSRLLRRSFYEGKDTKRQILWVISSNENAIKRYKHYGFVEENMYDYVMQYKKN